MPIQLVVGLGNPGPEYRDTRHNAGANLVEALGRQFNAQFAEDKKSHGYVARVRIQGNDVRLLLPTTYMNNSGRAVAAVANFFKIPVDDILVAHDEIDLPVGTVRLKQGGGGGGNGIKDVIASLGNNKNFKRVRIGVGHPGSAAQVVDYVLKRPRAEEQPLIDDSIDDALQVLPLVIVGEWEKAMKELHTKSVTSRQSPVARKNESD